MAVTKTKRLHQMQEDEAEGLICADGSFMMHVFEDGWSVRKMVSAADIYREGYLMRNCLRVRVEEAEGRASASASLFDTAKGSLHSLRDENNLPHLTFRVAEKSHACEIFGFKNSEGKDIYLTRLDKWLIIAGLRSRKEQEEEEAHRFERMRALLQADVALAAAQNIPVMTPEQEARLYEAYCRQDEPEYAEEDEPVAVWLQENFG